MGRTLVRPALRQAAIGSWLAAPRGRAETGTQARKPDPTAAGRQNRRELRRFHCQRFWSAEASEDRPIPVVPTDRDVFSVTFRISNSRISLAGFVNQYPLGPISHFIDNFSGRADKVRSSAPDDRGLRAQMARTPTRPRAGVIVSGAAPKKFSLLLA